MNFQVYIGYTGNSTDPENTGISCQAAPGDTVVFTYTKSNFDWGWGSVSELNPDLYVYAHGNDANNYWSNTGVSYDSRTEGANKILTITVPNSDTGISEIRVQISADGNDAAKSTHIANSSFSGGGDINSDTNTYPITLTLNATNGWYATQGGLDPDHNTYTLTEIVPSGAAYVPFSYTMNGTTLTPDQAGLVTVTPGTVIVTNRVLDGALKLKKIIQNNGVDDSSAGGDYYFSLQRVDQSNQPLGEPMYINLWMAGNTINDYRVMTKTAYERGDYKNYDTLNQTVITVDENATIQNLPDGLYKLVETQAPAGYNMMTESIFFAITGGAVTWTDEAGTVMSSHAMVTYTPAQAAVADDPTTSEDETAAASPATFTVGNTPGVELPSTGGPGTAVYTAAGLSLLLGAALFLLLRRRREQN